MSRPDRCSSCGTYPLVTKLSLLGWRCTRCNHLVKPELFGILILIVAIIAGFIAISMVCNILS
jgi:hypothetical protein